LRQGALGLGAGNQRSDQGAQKQRARETTVRPKTSWTATNQNKSSKLSPHQLGSTARRDPPHAANKIGLDGS
jgi:hypothetical protein